MLAKLKDNNTSNTIPVSEANIGISTSGKRKVIHRGAHKMSNNRVIHAIQTTSHVNLLAVMKIMQIR